MRPASLSASFAAIWVYALGAATALRALADPPQTHPPVTAVSDGREVSIDGEKGHYLALHFVGACSSPEATTFVRETVRQAPAVAGVTHLFISPDPTERVKEWAAAQFGEDSPLICLDNQGALAADLGVRPNDSAGGSPTPATVVLGSDGAELFRSVGAGPDDYLAFDRFASQMANRTRPDAFVDYNLPKDKPLAVDGYDVVAYFTQGRAVRGKPEIASVYRGISYRFATEENRRLFAAEPTKYLPTYGGWCASAMGAKGTKVEIDPTSFKVKDGRLFLFYTGLFSSAIKDWNKHEAEWEPAADSNWQKLTREEPVKPPE